jgi:hypothetical protein
MIELGGQVLLVPVIASSLVLGACGAGGQASGSSPATTTDAALAPTSPTPTHSAGQKGVLRLQAPQSRDEKQAYRTAAGLYRALAVTSSGGSAAQGAGAVCKLMSRQTQTRMITGAKVAAGPDSEWSCESAVRFLLERSKQDGSLTAPNDEQVIGVKVVGETATATVKAAGGRTSYLQLVKEGRQWKLASLG